MKYIIITPAKDESAFIDKTIKSVITQTILPIKWVIVDDGSSDSTAEIVSAYAKNHKWIHLLKIQNQNEIRSGGVKVVNAFNKGYSIIKDEVYDVIVKLDADLILPANYFERIINIFITDPKVGLAGGLILNKFGNKLIQEGPLDYHVRGAFKAYRRECFEQIGGFKPVWNWDGLDEMETMYKGWKTQTVDLKVVHLRPTTSAYNLRKHAFKSGVNAYEMKMSFLLMFLRSIKQMFSKPYLFYGLNYMYGFIFAWHSGIDQIIDNNLADFINKFHYNRILRSIGFK